MTAYCGWSACRILLGVIQTARHGTCEGGLPYSTGTSVFKYEHARKSRLDDEFSPAAARFRSNVATRVDVNDVEAECTGLGNLKLD